MSAIKNALGFVKHEFLAVLPPTLYFLLSFNIVVLTTSLVLHQNEVHVAFHASATVLALMIGKVVLVVDKIEFTRRLDGKPLAYPILFKAVAYSLFVLLFRLIELWIVGEEIVWRFFAMSQIWILVLFIVYFSFAELVAAFGLSRRDLITVFFQEHPTRRTDAT